MKLSYYSLFKKSYKINSKVRKIGSTSLTGLFFNRLSNFFLPFFIYLSVKANSITYFNFFLCLLSCVIFLNFNQEYLFLNYFCFFIFMLFDHIDGGLARFNNYKTFWGKFIDGLVDALFFSFFYFFTLIFYYKLSGDFLILVYGIIGIIIFCFDIFLLDRFSAITRWCNEENKLTKPTYIRKNNLLKVNIIFQDLNFILISLIFFFGLDSPYVIKIIYSFFTLLILSGIINYLVHIKYAYKNFNYRKK